MIPLWLGIFFLAASWLFGTDYFYSHRWGLWAAFVSAGVALIAVSSLGASGPLARPLANPGQAGSRQSRNLHFILAGCLVPAIWFAPWPHRLAPCLAALGLLSNAWFPTRHAFRRLANGLIFAAIILWVQDLALLTYRSWTARSHELPAFIPWTLAQLGHLLHLDLGQSQSTLVLPSMRENHALGGTWEFFLDPPTLCFLAGGWVVVTLSLLRPAPPKPSEDPPAAPAPKQLSRAEIRREKKKSSIPPPARVRWTFPAPWRPALAWLLASVVWLFLRATLLIGLYMHRALITDYDASLTLMPQFWNPWLQIALLLPLVVFHARKLNLGLEAAPGTIFDSSRGWVPSFKLPVALSAASACMLTLTLVWEPIGQRKAGRIAVDEYHSRWEPTGRPFDTEWYGHLSGYNYACIYDYCSRFYDMSRLTNALTDSALENLDVLVLKVPTDPYRLEEIGAVMRFVERGGGVLLVGEHTDVFGTGFHLNALARRFGFVFRYDCLFGIDSFFDQYYEPSFTPHPVVQHVRNMDFATSCSIQPLSLAGRSVITSTGLKNSLADYHVSNYYPQAVDHAAMRYGAFVQLWSKRHKQGRVLAFTDSTIFSNFCTFEPGKAELMLGMLEWLNHRDRVSGLRPALLALGAGLLIASLRLLRRNLAALPFAAAAAAGVWALTAAGVVQFQSRSMPPPTVKRPFVQITTDRTVCDGPLPKNGFIDGRANGFGIFERWMLRLGYFTRRESGPGALAGDLIVFFYPNQTIQPAYRDAFVNYIAAGGRALILDSPENTNSTAAALLQPFKLSQRAVPRLSGQLKGPEGFPDIPVENANEVIGGHAFASVASKPVAAVARHGKGSVTLIGFGSTFTDSRMGVTGDVEPNAELRRVFDFQYALVRAVIGDKLFPNSSPISTPQSK